MSTYFTLRLDLVSTCSSSELQKQRKPWVNWSFLSVYRSMDGHHLPTREANLSHGTTNLEAQELLNIASTPESILCSHKFSSTGFQGSTEHMYTQGQTKCVCKLEPAHVCNFNFCSWFWNLHPNFSFKYWLANCNQHLCAWKISWDEKWWGWNIPFESFYGNFQFFFAGKEWKGAVEHLNSSFREDRDFWSLLQVEHLPNCNQIKKLWKKKHSQKDWWISRNVFHFPCSRVSLVGQFVWTRELEFSSPRWLTVCFERIEIGSADQERTTFPVYHGIQPRWICHLTRKKRKVWSSVSRHLSRFQIYRKTMAPGFTDSMKIAQFDRFKHYSELSSMQSLLPTIWVNGSTLINPKNSSLPLKRTENFFWAAWEWKWRQNKWRSRDSRALQTIGWTSADSHSRIWWGFHENNAQSTKVTNLSIPIDVQTHINWLKTNSYGSIHLLVKGKSQASCF